MRWLARAAEEAQASGRIELIAHIDIFASFWKGSLEPTWMRGEWVETLLQTMSDAALTDLANVILPDLDQLDPTLMVMRHPTGDIDVQGMLRAWAVLASQHGTPALSEDAQKIATRIVS